MNLIARGLSTLSLALAATAFTAPAHAFTAEWVAEGNDFPATIGGQGVLEYRNAGYDGASTFDWTVLPGSGGYSGNGSGELWLLSPPNTATTHFTVESTAVAFVMNGDFNDGFARFLVDDQFVGEFDMFQRGPSSLVVRGLDLGLHSLAVVQVGEKISDSSDIHVAILGGAALATVPLPAPLWLLGAGAVALLRRRVGS